MEKRCLKLATSLGVMYKMAAVCEPEWVVSGARSESVLTMNPAVFWFGGEETLWSVHALFEASPKPGFRIRFVEPGEACVVLEVELPAVEGDVVMVIMVIIEDDMLVLVVDCAVDVGLVDDVESVLILELELYAPTGAGLTRRVKTQAGFP